MGPGRHAVDSLAGAERAAGPRILSGCLQATALELIVSPEARGLQSLKHVPRGPRLM